MVHGPDQRDRVQQARGARQVLAYPDTGDGSWDGPVLAADLGRRVGLGVKGFEVAWAAVVEEKDARTDRRTVGDRWARPRGGNGQRPEAQPGQARGPQELTAAQSGSLCHRSSLPTTPRQYYFISPREDSAASSRSPPDVVKSRRGGFAEQSASAGSPRR